MKRKTALLLSAAITAASVLQPYGAFAASGFSDLSQVPWKGGEEYINKAAELGLIAGDIDPDTGNRIFRPRDKVTYCETVQLAYNILSKTNNLESTEGVTNKWKVIMSENNIPSWAYNAVAYALEYDIISIKDAAQFIQEDGKTNNYATREGVAVIFGKAFAKMHMPDMNAELTFTDSEKVAPTSVPYIDMMHDLEIFVGDSENNFNPKRYINRTEMAVVSTKSSELFAGYSSGSDVVQKPEGDAMRGTVTSVEPMGDKMLVTILSGEQNYGYLGDAKTPCFDSKGEQYNFENIKKGDIITVTYVENEILDVTVNYTLAETVESSITGIIDDITDKTIFVNTDSGKLESSKYADSVKFTLNNEPVDVQDIILAVSEGEVQVTVDMSASGQALKVSARTTVENYIDGTIKAITENSINMKKTDGPVVTYNFNSDIIYKLDDVVTTLSNISKKVKEQTVYVKVYLKNNGGVSRILAYSEAFKRHSVTGVVTELTSDTLKIIADNGTLETYRVDSECQFFMSGLDSTRATLKDAIILSNGLNAEVTINANGAVTHVMGRSEQSQANIPGVATSFDGKTISITNQNNTDKTYNISAAGASYYLDGFSTSESKLKTTIENSDRVYVMLSTTKNASVDKVVALSYNGYRSFEVSGTLSVVDLKNNPVLIRLSDSSISRKDFYVDKDATIVLNGENITAEELHDALSKDSINVSMERNSSGVVTDLYAESSKYDVSTEKYVAGYIRNIYSDGLSLRNSDGTATSYDLARGVLCLYNGDRTTIGNLKTTCEKNNVDAILVLNSDGEVSRIVAGRKVD